MKELSEGVQKIFRDAITGTPSLLMEPEKEQPFFDSEAFALPYLTLVSTSQEGEEGRKENPQEVKGGGLS